MSLPPLPPTVQTYDAAVLLGQPYTISPLAPHLFPRSGLQQYVSEASAAPSAPPLSTAASPTSSLTQNIVQYWRHHGLDTIANIHQVCIKHRRGDKYIITDTMNSLLYTAVIDMEMMCFCCSQPKGPGITFNLTSRNDHHVLVVHTDVESHCCSPTETTAFVCIPPDVNLGTIEGTNTQFTLNNPSGDVLCYIKKEEVGCCTCTIPTHQVIPAGFPHDVGTVAYSDGGLIVTFPAVLDVPSRTLLLCFALNLQYIKEEDERSQS